MIFLLLTATLFFFYIKGQLMTEEVIGIYLSESCRAGKLATSEFPPVASPISWMRLVVLIGTFLLTITQAQARAKLEATDDNP